MRAILASTVAEWMYRGTDYISRWQVLQEDGETIQELTGTEEVKMILARSWTEPSLIEIEGEIVAADEGRVMFVFKPEDTEDLPARAYDRTVLVGGDVVAQDRFALRGINQGVINND